MSWLIRTENLGKYYSSSDKWGLRDITLDLSSGQFVAVVGHNGAGKSTFFHVLAGLLDPTSGQVWYQTDQPSIGWCSQMPSIDWYLTVFDNIYMGARLAGHSSQRSTTMTDDILEIVGLQKVADNSPTGLSGGQQQRVKIARALVASPTIMILDEPTNGLDAVAATELMNYVADQVDESRIALVSSHDLSLLESYCDSILFLQEGTLVCYEPRDTFLNRFKHQDVFVVSYEGKLTRHDVQPLTERGFVVTSMKPLEFIVSEALSLPDATQLLQTLPVTITDLRRQPPGLREAYMALADNADTRAASIAQSTNADRKAVSHE